MHRNAGVGRNLKSTSLPASGDVRRYPETRYAGFPIVVGELMPSADHELYKAILAGEIQKARQLLTDGANPDYIHADGVKSCLLYTSPSPRD